MTSDPYNVTADELRQFVERYEQLEAEKKDITEQQKEVMAEAKGRGFDNAVMLDPLGHVAELATSNIWMVKDGIAMTPVPNGCFLNGITRQRVIALLRGAGQLVEEKTLRWADFLAADEIFTTGNFAKVTPITRIEQRHLQPGPVYARARQLYWDYAHGRFGM